MEQERKEEREGEEREPVQPLEGRVPGEGLGMATFYRKVSSGTSAIWGQRWEAPGSWGLATEDQAKSTTPCAPISTRLMLDLSVSTHLLSVGKAPVPAHFSFFQ